MSASRWPYPPNDVLASITVLSKWLSGPEWGNVCWTMTLFCGFLVLGPTMATTVHGIILRLNMALLPRELRPGWFVRIGLVATAIFFTLLATVGTLNKLGVLKSY